MLLSISGGWLLLGLAAFNAANALRGRVISRINAILHSLMGITMSAMLFNLEWPILPQLIVFSVASLWFTVQALGRSELNMYSDVGDRLKHFYDAGSMAALVLMLYPSPSSVGHENSPATGIVSHHSPISPTWPAGMAPTIPGPFYVAAAVFFIASAAAFLWIALRRIDRRDRPRMSWLKGACPSATEALSALVMALMFATLI